MGKFEQALARYARYVIKQARSNLTKKRNNASKKLYNSLKYKVSENKVTFEMESVFDKWSIRKE